MNRILSWAEEDRPREKLVLNGAKSLTKAELIAILFGSGSRDLSAVDLARMLLDNCDNQLNNLNQLSINELKQIKGIGTAKATVILAAMELANRKIAENPGQINTLKSSRDAYSLVNSRLSNLQHEEFHVIYMNRANKVIGVEQISKGGISGTVADGKVIYNLAIKYKASAMILAHNHPSGQLKPSEADKKLTRALIDFGKLIEIQILDHLIITKDNYFSFADEGILNH